jgi:hypothetical protein
MGDGKAHHVTQNRIECAIAALPADEHRAHRLKVSNVELERQSRFARLGCRKHDFADRICKADGDGQPIIMQLRGLS